MRVTAAAIAISALTAASPAAAVAPNFAIDLSQHMVSIAADFSGAHLLLFGAVPPDGDVVVVVRGPSHPKVVRKKERISGIWVNRQSVHFNYVPSFYAVAASRPLRDIAPLPELQKYGIGIRFVDIRGPKEMMESDIIVFREALIRNMEAAGLFANQTETVHLVGGGPLFRTNVQFPGNAPVGPYQVHVFLFKDGQVIKQTATPLAVSRVGFAAEVFNLAHRHPFGYGVLAILIAAMAGWFANFIFRRSA